MRNTKVITILERLQTYKCNIKVSDEYAHPEEAKTLFNINLKSLGSIIEQDVVIIAVDHNQYKNFKKSEWSKMLKPKGIIIDVKSIYSLNEIKDLDFTYWRL